MVAESKLRDRKDPTAALAVLESMQIPGNSRFDVRHGLLKAEAQTQLGQPDSAKAILQGLIQRHPNSQPAKDALAKIP